VPEKFWLALLGATGTQDSIGADPRFATARDRIRNYSALSDAFAPLMAQRPRSEWEEAFSSHDVPFAPVHSIAEVIADPQVRHLGTFAAARHPQEGDIVGIRNPLRINGARSDVVAPPAVDEHRGAKFGNGPAD